MIWECECDCGRLCSTRSSNLRSGRTKSCGCLCREIASATGKKRFVRSMIGAENPWGGRYSDCINKSFGMLTVLDLHSSTSRRGVKAVCKCSCGNVTTTNMRQILRGGVVSCGCYKVSLAKTLNASHGKSSTNEYCVWQGMHTRCRNKKQKAAHNYVNRGIRVCNRWDKFENFYEDMGERPTDDHTLERIDNDKGYSPDNCKWATKSEQANNTRMTRRVLYGGVCKPASDWDRYLGFPVGTVSRRLRDGWSEEEAITLPTNTRRNKLNRKEAKND